MYTYPEKTKREVEKNERWIIIIIIIKFNSMQLLLYKRGITNKKKITKGNKLTLQSSIIINFCIHNTQTHIHKQKNKHHRGKCLQFY